MNKEIIKLSDLLKGKEEEIGGVEGRDITLTSTLKWRQKKR